MRTKLLSTRELKMSITEQITSVFPDVKIGKYIVFGNKERSYTKPVVFSGKKGYTIVYYDLRGPIVTYHYNNYDEIYYCILDIILSEMATNYARENPIARITFRERYYNRIIELAQMFDDKTSEYFIAKYRNELEE